MSYYPLRSAKKSRDIEGGKATLSVAKAYVVAYIVLCVLYDGVMTSSSRTGQIGREIRRSSLSITASLSVATAYTVAYTVLCVICNRVLGRSKRASLAVARGRS